MKSFITSTHTDNNDVVIRSSDNLIVANFSCDSSHFSDREQEEHAALFVNSYNLLNEIVIALNSLPNQRLRGSRFDTTYAICSAIDKLLKG
jgi:hypothetical protein